MTRQALERMLPLYEAKMIHLYDHRWATYEPDGTVRDVTLEEKRNPDFVVMPRYWVREELVRDRLEGKWDQDWLIGWRDICRSTDERTMIVSTFPTSAVGHTIPIVLTDRDTRLLQVVLSSYAFDFVARQKVGGTHMTYGYLEQLCVPGPALTPPWSGGSGKWFMHRVDWLCSAEGWSDLDMRALIRAEIDAAMFHLYGLDRDEVDYVMDTFPIVKRKDEAAYGEYRTKRLILEVYDAMAEAITSGVPYRSPIELSEVGP